jgi:F-type H+-transporting ATPase subunit gamma
MSGDYLVEPSKVEILDSLLPKALRTKMYACLLDSNASEHGARVVAMQVATDNANELINELTILYNKTRQQAITSELLDIVGGAAALSN